MFILPRTSYNCIYSSWMFMGFTNQLETGGEHCNSCNIHVEIRGFPTNDVPMVNLQG